MDSRVTKSRLARVISYDWLKIIIMIAAIAFVWALAFTIGAPRISAGQQFDFYVFDCDFAKSKGESEILADAEKEGVFSYDVLDFGYRQFTEDYFSTIMSAATAISEGDVLIISDFESDIKNNASRFRSFVDGYGAYVGDYADLCERAKKYCLTNNLITAEGDVYSLNETAIAAYFKKRMKNDPRFRTQEKIEAGIENEIIRIKSVWNNALILQNIISEHPEAFVTYRRYGQSLAAAGDDEKQSYQELYDKFTDKLLGVNLGKLSGGAKEITELFSKATYSEPNENGEQEMISSNADGIVMCLFDYGSAQLDLQYESIAFVNYIFKTYSGFYPSSISGLIA